MANYNLTGQKIKNTYEQLTQVSASLLVDGLGNPTTISASNIQNFDSEVSASAAASGFGGGSIDTSSLVQETVFGEYTSSNDSKVDALIAATSSYLTSLPSGVISGSSQVDLSLATGTAANATSASYALNSSTADSATSSTSASYASNASTADSATSASYAVTASYAENAGAAFPYTGSAGIQGNLDINLSKNMVISDWTGSLNNSSMLIGYTGNQVDRVNTSGTNNVQIGYNARIVESSIRNNCVVIGADAQVAQNSVSIGQNASALVDSGVAIGHNSQVFGNSGIAIGANITGTVNNGVLIGTGVTDYAVNIGDVFVYGSGSNQSGNETSILSQGFNLFTPLITNQGVNGYADDTAAKAAGLGVGSIYHTSGSLKVVTA